MVFINLMSYLNGMDKYSRVRIHKMSSNVIVLLLDSERDSGEVIVHACQKNLCGR